MTQLTEFDDLDFFQVRTKLINYLSSKSEFEDHNFEGAVWSSMLDMMAYAITYTGIHANMALNEAFLDSAQLRPNIVSHAKKLNYFPRTINAATAIINVSVSSPNDASANNDSIVLPKNLKFSASDNTTSYIFVTTSPQILYREGTSSVYSGDITIVEGKLITQQWTIPAGGIASNDLALNNINVDSKYLTVNVKSSPASNVLIPYNYAKDIFYLESDSNVYFLQETPLGEIAIYFGDDIFGKKIEGNNVVIAEYLLTNGKAANGISAFEMISDVVYDSWTLSRSDFTLSLIERASLGADRETKESIRFSAPRSFEAQNRAVTAIDYEQLLTERYGFIQSVNVWGGEENNPPLYGRVFISIKPWDKTFLSVTDKEKIYRDVLNKYNIIGIIPEIIDPEIVYISIDTEILYDQANLPVSNTQLQLEIKAAIEKYFSDNLSRFNKIFRYSKLVSAIDGVHGAILNNRTYITLEKRIFPLGGAVRIYEYTFANSIDVGTFVSNIINDSGTTYQYKDDGNGQIFVYQNGIKGSIAIGEVNYTTGDFILRDYAFPWSSTDNYEVRFSAIPSINDVNVQHNSILILGDTSINLTETDR